MEIGEPVHNDDASHLTVFSFENTTPEEIFLILKSISKDHSILTLPEKKTTVKIPDRDEEGKVIAGSYGIEVTLNVKREKGYAKSITMETEWLASGGSNIYKIVQKGKDTEVTLTMNEP